MIYVGLDVAKDKLDCFIANSNVEVFIQIFLSLTIVKALKPYFKELSSYQMIEIK